MKTTFANVINVKANPAELILEFGAFFPTVKEGETPPSAPPDDFAVDTRVVLNIASAKVLLEGLTQVISRSQAQTAGSSRL